ncbi:MAG: branched-chain amino acid ABC transporter permease [Candidatus Dadabacteria bacterium]|nr:MAG: branched-chain amino acid ABC transporter permease [Candidatus Dadabacteria bacterium]
MEYFIHLIIIIGIYLILAQSFNLTLGLGLLFNLAHVSVYAVGAYVTALLATELGMGFFGCLVCSVLICGLFAIILGAISIKLKEDYFAIGTLAFSSVISALLINWKSLTHGVLGIPGIPRPEFSFLKVDFYDNINFLVLTYVLVAITFFMLYLFFNNFFARTLRAQSEFRQATKALGKNTRLTRNMSFFIASCFAGLAGSLYAYYINYIDPSSFSLTEMIFVLTVVVVGKPGSFWGCVFGTVFLVLLPEPLRFTRDVPLALEWLFGMPYPQISAIPVLGWLITPVVSFLLYASRPSVLGPMRQMLYAVILFIVVYFRREALFPVQRRV